jgi:polyhydroxyalkanoate synthesis regulator phasin
MLVYCTTLWLNCPSDQVFYNIAAWLSEKTGERITPDTLRRPINFTTENRDTIRVVKWDEDYPKLYSITHQHPDRDADGNKISTGRLWTTEIGVRCINANSPVELSVMVSTYEVSTRVNTRIQLKCPEIVPKVLENCSPTPRTPGCFIAQLHERDAEIFWDLLQDPERQHALVLVSPTKEGPYPVDLRNLQSQLGGLADIIRVSRKADTYALADYLGKAYSAWNGAINVIFPRQKDQISFYSKRLMLEDIEQILPEEGETWTADDKRVAEILSIVTHRSNLPNMKRHISPQLVTNSRLHGELSIRREEALKSGDLETFYRSYIQELEECLSKERQEYQEERDQLLYRIINLEDRLTLQTSKDVQETYIEQLRAQVDALQASFAYSRPTAETTFTEPVKVAFINALNECPTLEESLKVIEALFGDRVVILDSAWSSARDAESYKYKDTGFELLWKLVTQYWEVLSNGKGDTEARAIFGMNKYSAKESETVTFNRRARLLRTFRYKGEDVYMEKHLRDNVNPSVVETIRVHFHWDAEDRKIVIGHCGAHLDHH